MGAIAFLSDRAPAFGAACLAVASVAAIVAAGTARHRHGRAGTGLPSTSAPTRAARAAASIASTSTRVGRRHHAGTGGRDHEPVVPGDAPERPRAVRRQRGQRLRRRRTWAPSARSPSTPSGRLFFLNQQPSVGADPCHLVVDPSGRHVLVANYSSGTVAVLPLASSGGCRRPPSSTTTAAAGPSRAPGGPALPRGRLRPVRPIRVRSRPRHGSDPRVPVRRRRPAASSPRPGRRHGPRRRAPGPRHLAWHPSGRMLYAINELELDRHRVPLRPHPAALTDRPDASRRCPTGSRARTPPPRSPCCRTAASSTPRTAATTASPCSPSIRPTGTLTPAGHVPTGGKTPRHFAVDAVEPVAPRGEPGLRLDHDLPARRRHWATVAAGAGRGAQPVCVLFAGRPLTRVGADTKVSGGARSCKFSSRPCRLSAAQQ